jgi:hypothetical protein
LAVLSEQPGYVERNVARALESRTFDKCSIESSAIQVRFAKVGTFQMRMLEDRLTRDCGIEDSFLCYYATERRTG